MKGVPVSYTFTLDARSPPHSTTLMYRFQAIFAALAIATSTINGLSAGNPGIGNLDPGCPKGLHPGFEVNTFQYNIPAQKFFNATGSFFQGEWYVRDAIPFRLNHTTDSLISVTCQPDDLWK